MTVSEVTVPVLVRGFVHREPFCGGRTLPGTTSQARVALLERPLDLLEDDER